MATDIDIASNALIRLGHKAISSFDEPGAGATVATNLYQTIVNRALTEHYWRFAVKKVTLAKTTSTPLNGYQYEFQLPPDYLAVITLRPISNYQIFEDKIYTNQNNIDLDYVFRPDTTSFPEYFTHMLELMCAAEFAMPVTQSTTLAQFYESAWSKDMAHARSIDSRSSPPIPIQDQPFTDVRLSGSMFSGGYSI